MIKCLAGQGARLSLTRGQRFGVIHAIGILHQRIKAAPRCPGAEMAVGGKRHTDDAGVEGRECLWREAMPGNGARAIALQKNIGTGGKIAKLRLVIGVTQIKRGGSFTAPGIHHQFIKARQMRGADMQNIGAMRGQCAPCHRPGNDACEVKHAEAAEGTLGGWRQGHARRIANFLDQHRRQAGSGLALGRGIPFIQAARHCHHKARFRCRRFEIRRAPGAECRSDRSAIMRDIAKQAQHAVAMMREIRVQPHPSPIATLIEPRNRIPARAGRLARDAEPMF